MYQIRTVYRPPDELADYQLKLDQSWQVLQPQNIVIVDDFNADPSTGADSAQKHLRNITAALALQNWIQQPTRITPSRQSFLDLLLSDMDVVLFYNLCVCSCDTCQ